jgi:hypothetical protein
MIVDVSRNFLCHGVTDGGANILNKQSRTADKGWSSRLRVGHGANNSSSLKISLLRNVTNGLSVHVT